MPTEEELANMSPEEIAKLQKQNCIFCRIGSGEIPAKKIYDDEDSIAVLDINPAAKGHILLLPKEHYSVMPQLPAPLTEHLFMVAKGLSQALLKGLQAKGTTIFVANGVAAGQRAPHFMIHLIPRSHEDSVSISIPEKSFPKKDLDAVAKVLKKALGAKVEEAEVVRETPKKKEPEKAKEEKPVKKEKAEKKKASAPARKKDGKGEPADLDSIAGLFTDG